MTDRRRRTFRPQAWACAVAVLAVVAVPPAVAQDSEVFEVRGVAVDVTAETAAAAREEALAIGEKLALERLFERMTLSEDRDYLPDLNSEDRALLVRDFAVAEEKTSAVRYLATLNYRFNAEEVRNLLIDYGVPFAETPSKPVLVLPAYEAAGALVLWDDPNPWRAAWRTRPVVEGLVPLVLPVGDLADIAAIGVEQAVAGDRQRLDALARRYGTGDVLVAHAILGLDPDGGRPLLEVLLARYSPAGPEHTTADTFRSAEGESTDTILARAATALAAAIEDEWKRDNLMQFGRPGVTAVAVPIGGLGDWLAVRSRLGRVAVVRRFDLVLLSRDEARLNLHYLGDVDQLSLALAQADLILSEQNGDWTLGLAVGSRPDDS